MKKKIKLIVPIVSALILILITYNLLNSHKKVELSKQNKKIDENLDNQYKKELLPKIDDKEKNNNDTKEEVYIKPDYAYGEEIVKNFGIIYTALLNDSKLPLNNIESVVMKDSKFYDYIINYIKDFRQQKKSIKMIKFSITDIEEDSKNGILKISTEENYEIKLDNGEIKNESNSNVYTVLFKDSSISIENRISK